MKHTEFNWQGSDGKKIFGQQWLPDTDTPKAIICLVHGMGEHSSRYGHVADFFNQQEMAVITFDHQGHGKSEGARGHVKNYEVLLDSVDQLLQKANEAFPNAPKIIYGHSMGGNVVINHALRRKPQVSGVIATGPWLKLPFSPPKIKLWVGQLMRHIYPAFTENTNLDRSGLSRDPEVIKKYNEDPLVHPKISTSFFFGCFEAGLWAIDHAKDFSIPLLLMHGTEDKLTAYEGSKEFAANAPDGLVAFRSCDGFYHELHNEPEKEAIFGEMLSWVKRCI